MSTLTLASIVEAADRKYGPTVIDLGDGRSMTLTPVLRLSKEKRKELAELSKDHEGADDNIDADERMIATLRIVATDRKDVDHFIKLIDGDLAIISEVFSAYSEGSDLGEASPSES